MNKADQRQSQKKHSNPHFQLSKTPATCSQLPCILGTTQQQQQQQYVAATVNASGKLSTWSYRFAATLFRADYDFKS